MKRIILFLATLSASLTGYGQGNLYMQMIYVKGGNFFMGSDDPKFHSPEYDNERPVHRVGITSYYIGKYEVTQGLWKQVMGIYPPAYNGVDYTNKDCDNCPVVKVNYDDILDFIRRLNEKTGKEYRLPTETEWEYAARGGKYSKNYNYSGSNKMVDAGWNGHRKGAAHPIGQKPGNELSIYDMSGNVLEWCADWYGADYYAKTIDETDPKGPVNGEKRVLRGGSYFDDDISCRPVHRTSMLPNTRQWNIGFRLAMDAPEGAQ